MVKPIVCKCVCCGVTFTRETRNQRRCNNCKNIPYKVIAKDRRDNNCNKIKYTISCEICGKKFTTYYSYTKYCSEECREIARSKETIRHCARCGKEFRVSTFNRKYCSSECRKAETLDMHRVEYWRDKNV